MQVPFDSTFLIALRLLMVLPPGAPTPAALLTKVQLTDEQVAQLRVIRERYSTEVLASRAGVSQADQEAAGLAIWRETWAFMASAFSSDQFALFIPPIYSGAQLRVMLEKIFSAFRHREVVGGVCPTGHPVISGDEGTGKTTIVKAIAVAVAVCSPVMFMLFANYEDETGVAATGVDRARFTA